MTNIRETIYKKFEELIEIAPYEYKIERINLDIEYYRDDYSSDPHKQICIRYDNKKKKK